MPKNTPHKSSGDSQKPICYVRAKLIVCPWKGRISDDIVLYGPGLTIARAQGILKLALMEFRAKYPHLFDVDGVKYPGQIIPPGNHLPRGA